MDTRKTVTKARFGEPQPCPICGGQLMPAFGMVVDGLKRYPVLDESSVMCRDCGESFKVREESGGR